MRVWREAGWGSWRGPGAAGEVEAVEEADPEPCKKGAGSRLVAAGVSHPVEVQEDEGDEGDEDLDFDGILGAAEEGFDLQVLLDPLEEELDLPALLVERGDLDAGDRW